MKRVWWNPESFISKSKRNHLVNDHLSADQVAELVVHTGCVRSLFWLRHQQSTRRVVQAVQAIGRSSTIRVAHISIHPSPTPPQPFAQACVELSARFDTEIAVPS